MGTMKVIAAVLFVLVSSCHYSTGYPLHASCKIKWTWDVACSDVQSAIVDQINKWSGDDCGSGEKCKYKLTGNAENKVTATHTTPKKKYVDDLTFDFTPTGGNSGCQVQGKSTSETWYAILDYSTNYCNLHNLITGAGLDKQPGYVESTSDSVCTQYSSANCEKY
ncbi:hypothetical protein BaRGS_00032308 [Batillaria attramentaria]|uniref:Uncharacterized protein n=1 Tax=Batillaria attramentaria TaxID=370345 RepID=A0ABD0JP53_9CAEN